MPEEVAALTNSPRFLAPLLLILAIALEIAVAPVAASQDAATGWRTDNNKLVVEQVDEGPNTTTFLLRNTSEKTVTALSICHGNTTSSIEYFQSSEVLNPDTSCSIVAGNSQLHGLNRILNVCALVFEDGSWEGSETEVLLVGATRLGRVVETERVKSILEAYSQLDLNDEEIDRLKRRIGGLSESPAEALDSVSDVSIFGLDLASIRAVDRRLQRGFWSGVRHAREAALWKLDRLAQLPQESASSTPNVSPSRASPRRRLFSGVRAIYEAMSAENQQLLQRKPDFLQFEREGGEQ